MTKQVRPRLLLPLSLSVAISAHAISAWCDESKSVPPNPAALVDREALDYCKVVQGELAAGQFDQLEAEARQLASLQEHFRSGVEKLMTFYDSLANPGCGDYDCNADYRPRLRQLQDWLNRDPALGTPRLAMAQSWWGHAWTARRCAAFKDVTFDDWQAFHDRMRVALSYLHGINGRADPEFYRLKLGFLRDSGGTRGEIDTAFAEGHHAFPKFLELVGQYAQILDPTWYGEEGDIGRLADAMLDDLGGDDGLIAYAVVARAESLNIRYPHLFLETGLKWTRAKAGLALIDARYGTSNLDWNLTCYMAMTAKDRSAAAAAYQHFGSDWNPKVWGNGSYFNDQVLPWLTGQTPP